MIPADPDPNGWLALDVGGANLKAYHASGRAEARPFELWKRPGDLPKALADLVGSLSEADRVALTMTGELCDGYSTKAEGVRAILSAVEEAASGRPVVVWGIDGRFHEPGEIRGRPLLAAAANWLALATASGRLAPAGPALLIDVGSTTTDLIPLVDGSPAPRGLSDTDRLRTGELVYAGARRTPVCALSAELDGPGGPTGLMAELFATTLDVYLTLGDIPPDPGNLGTADGRPATVEGARDRLARMVGADREGFSAEDARALSRSADRALMDRLVGSAERATGPIGRPASAVVGGSGEFLARRVASAVLAPGGRVVRLSGALGPETSACACAWAVAVLAGEAVP